MDVFVVPSNTYYSIIAKSFLLSVCLCLSIPKITRTQLNKFSWNLPLENFAKKLYRRFVYCLDQNTIMNIIHGDLRALQRACPSRVTGPRRVSQFVWRTETYILFVSPTYCYLKYYCLWENLKKVMLRIRFTKMVEVFPCRAIT